MREPCAPFGPKYPKLEGLEKWRRLARYRELTREEKHTYGDAVRAAIRKLNKLAVKYTRPNPFPMVGDPPKDKNVPRDQQLYEYAMRTK